MQFTLSAIAALAAFVNYSAAHMTMSDPPQWAVPGEALAPLAADGSDFPCQSGTADPTASRTYEAGSDAILQVVGSAVHGGGSGQMVITYDFPPTKDSVWRVMQSWEGDHPVVAPRVNGVTGNFEANPTMTHAPITWSVPKDLPSGRAVVAWNWFNKVGNREMYMKCSTVEIKGAEASDASTAPGFLALPTMLRANSGNGCTVPENIDSIKFKNPGPNVVTSSSYAAVAIDCDSSEAGTAGSSTGEPSPTSPSAAPSDVSEAPAPTKTPSVGGGEDESGSGDAKEPIATQPNASAAPTATAAPIASPAPIKKPVESAAPAPSQPAQPEEGASGETCPEGKFYCNADGTWSQCGSGRVQNMGQIPAGMQCTEGQFSVKSARRAVRFSPEHMRRRH